MNISGKIDIVKISGAGELTGNLSKTISGNTDGEIVVDFSDITFTQAGDYQIALKYSGNDVVIPEKIIKITVKEKEVQEQEEKHEEEQLEPNRPIIAQIFEPTIEKPTLTIDTSDAGERDSTLAKITYGDGGSKPVIFYHSYQIDFDDIKRFRLYHDGVLPMLSFDFYDSLALMQNSSTGITENGIISLFINSNSSNIKSILLDFRVIEIKRRAESQFHVLAYANIPNIYSKQMRSDTGTSFDVLQKICRELGLGFNSNINSTDDSMTWRSGNNDRIYQYMNNIISKSSIKTSENAFLLGYIDYYYCFNYVDIQKEFDRDVSEDRIVDTSTITNVPNKGSDKGKVIPLILTNDKSSRDSSCYVDNVQMINNAAMVNDRNLDANVSVTYNTATKSMQQYVIYNNVSNDENKMVLEDTNKSEKDMNVVYQFNGRFDPDNQYSEYNYQGNSNQRNRENFAKIRLKCRVVNPNLNLYLYQKVKYEHINPAETATKDTQLDERYSNEYIITNIEYVLDNGTLVQQLEMASSNLHKSQKDLEESTPKQRTEETETKGVNNNNQTSSDTSSSNEENINNITYNIGEYYTVIRNVDGEETVYELYITDIQTDNTIIASLENSNEYLPEQPFTPADNKFINNNDTYDYVISETASAYGNYNLSAEYTESDYDGPAEEVVNIYDPYTQEFQMEMFQSFGESTGNLDGINLEDVKPVKISAATKKYNGWYIMDFLVKICSLKDYQAAGVAGNMMAESGWNPTSVNQQEKNGSGVKGQNKSLANKLSTTGGYGAGLAQWTFVERKQPLLDWLKKTHPNYWKPQIEQVSLYYQLEMFRYEITKGQKSKIWNMLTQCKDEIESTKIILCGFENGGNGTLASVAQMNKYTWGGGYAGLMKTRTTYARTALEIYRAGEPPKK